MNKEEKIQNKILSIGLVLILGVMLVLLTGCGEQQPTPADAAGVVIMNQAQDFVDNSKMSEAEIQAFNSQFEAYAGTSVRGSYVRLLMTKIEQKNSTEDDRNIEITGITRSEVNSAKTYNVKFNYDSKGLINQAIIDEN